MTTTATPLREAPSLDQLISADNPRYWQGLERFARNNDAAMVNDVISVRDSYRVGTETLRDSMIPKSRTMAYDPTVRTAPGYELPRNRPDYDVFGADRSADPRAEMLVTYESGFSGLASEYCCGMDAATLEGFMRERHYNRGWYSIKYSFCWTQRLAAQHAGVFDLISTYSAAAQAILNKALTEVAFYGSKTFNLHGLVDLPIERLRLDDPLDTMTADEIYSYMVSAFYSDVVSRGEEGMTKTHMVAPPGYELLRAQRIPGTITGETVGDALDKGFSAKTYYTNYMNSISTDEKPGILLYNRNSQDIKRDLAFEPFLLPPIEQGGILTLQYVAHVGELRCHDSRSALIIENALQGAV